MVVLIGKVKGELERQRMVGSESCTTGKYGASPQSVVAVAGARCHGEGSKRKQGSRRCPEGACFVLTRKVLGPKCKGL